MKLRISILRSAECLKLNRYVDIYFSECSYAEEYYTECYQPKGLNAECLHAECCCSCHYEECHLADL